MQDTIDLAEATNATAERSGTVADAIVSRLGDWGVERVYGYSGDGVNGLLDAIRRADGELAFIQARHEESAGFMAVAEAKYGEGAGVVVATQGPGAIHLVNALYDAKLDGVPVVAIVGQRQRSALGSGTMQEVSLQRLFDDVATSYLVEASVPEQVPLIVDRAFRNAIVDRAPTVIIVPGDLQSEDAGPLPVTKDVMHTAAIVEYPVVTAPSARLREAAALLAHAQRPMILAGQGAAGEGAAVAALAMRLGAGVVTSLLGKPHIDETLPFVAGTMGHLGTTASAELLAECDALLIVGSNDPWTDYYPDPRTARAVQIDIDAKAIGNRFPVEVGLVADAGSALADLVELLPEAESNGWWSRVHEAVARWRAITTARTEVEVDGLNPELAVRALQPHLRPGVRIALDVGSVVYWYARQLVVPRGVPVHLSSTLASMGGGVPYGIAAKLGAPEQPVVVLTGDGGMQMSGLAELVTVAARWRGWRDPRFIIAVLDNEDLAEVSWEQREHEEAPRFAASQALPSVPYAEYAKLLGLDGMVVHDREGLAAAWARAFEADRPFLLQLRTDPAVPLVPPGGFDVDVMRASLSLERREGGPQAERAARLLEEYARIGW